MEKNVIVIDKNGINYGYTYLKRAKGLVKKGRACFAEENKIILTCPPAKERLDITMETASENNIKVSFIETQISKLVDFLITEKNAGGDSIIVSNPDLINKVSSLFESYNNKNNLYNVKMKALDMIEIIIKKEDMDERGKTTAIIMIKNIADLPESYIDGNENE